jgi:acyl-CoA dehydrogenase
MGSSSNISTGSAVQQPRSAFQLDEAKLLAFLRQHVPSLCASATSLRVQQFQHGQSNPTYLVEAGAARMVLRKQPPGKLLASAHAVDREFRVLQALSRAGRVPVPQPLAFCSDPQVLGTPFYVMSFAPGHIFLDPNLPQEGPRDRSRVFGALVDTLADLHSLDPAALGLGDFGQPQDYCRRQVHAPPAGSEHACMHAYVYVYV